MTDPLAAFYRQPFTVERYLGINAEGEVTFAAPVEMLGRVVFSSKLDEATDGDQLVVSLARVSMSAGTATIPVGSRVTVRGHAREVVTESHHLGGFPGSPDYYSVDLD